MQDAAEPPPMSLQGTAGRPAAGGAAGGGQGPAPHLLPAPHPAPHRAHPPPGPGGCYGVGGPSGVAKDHPGAGTSPCPPLPSPQPTAGTALAILEEVTSGESRQDVATKLVKIFLGQGLAVPLLDYLTARELARTSKCQGQGAPPAPPPQPANWVAMVPLMGREWGHQEGRRKGATCPRGWAHQGWLGHHPMATSPWPLRSSSGPQHPLPLQLAGLQVRGAVHEGERGRGHQPGPLCALP